MMATVTKATEVQAIAEIAGIPDPGPGSGSSVWKSLFDGLCDQFEIDKRGSMPEQAERIVTAAGLPYDRAAFDSRETVSGGGSTVTHDGLRQIRAAVEILVAR